VGSPSIARTRQGEGKGAQESRPTQKDILAKASRALVDDAVRANAKEIFLGDVRDIGNGVNLVEKSQAKNQPLASWKMSRHYQDKIQGTCQ
jgi:hypothetical protein